MWERRKEAGKKKRRKSNYSAGIIINSQLVPRNYSFEGHGRQKGKGDERKREKEEENGSFVEKLTTPFPHIAVAIVLTERTGNTTNGGPRLSSRACVALFTIFRPLFLPLFPPALRFSLAIAVFAVRTKASEKYVSSNQNPIRRAREGTPELGNAPATKKRRETCKWWTFKDQREREDKKKGRKGSRDSYIGRTDVHA